VGIRACGEHVPGCLGRTTSLRNIKLVGEQEYAALPSILSRWDVALIPFKDIPLTRATNPVKIYRVLWSREATLWRHASSRELQDFSDWVYLASGPEEFVAQVRERAAEGRDPELAVLRKQAWNTRPGTTQSDSLTAELRAWPLVSVVVLVLWKAGAERRGALRSAINGTAYPNGS